MLHETLKKLIPKTNGYGPPSSMAACHGNTYKVNGACANTSWRSSTRHEEPRTRIQKPRERLWVASELAGTFLPFADTENQFLSTFDSLSLRTHNKSHNRQLAKLLSGNEVRGKVAIAAVQMTLVRYRDGLEKFFEHSFLRIWEDSNAHDLFAELLRAQDAFFRGRRPILLTETILANRPDLVGTVPIWRPKPDVPPDDPKKPIRPDLSRPTPKNTILNPLFACSLCSPVGIQVSSVSFGLFSCSQLLVSKQKKSVRHCSGWKVHSPVIFLWTQETLYIL